MASKRFGVLVHGYAVLSNHYHLVLTDVHGNLPAFMGWLRVFRRVFHIAHEQL
jgi:hypothetical protein